jgi:NAD(P)H-hydrate epimerase
MRKLIDFQVLDCNATHYGIDLSNLMNNAGVGIADYICKNYKSNEKIVFVCGNGNNGGDGYVATSILLGKGFDVTIFQTSNPTSVIAKKKFLELGLVAENISELEEYKDKTDLLVDCLLGSGIQGEPRPPFDKYIEIMNSFENIMSVDVPSGIGSRYAIIPNVTITFHDYKVEMNKENSGIIILHKVGFSDHIDQRTGPGELLLYPEFESNKHKGQNGKIGIVGGGPYSGAPALAALGAYRAGIDLVHVFVPDSSYEYVSSFIPELIVHKLPGEIVTEEHLEFILDKTSEFDAVVVGPGIGKQEQTRNAIVELVKNCINIVLDADAIFDFDFKHSNILLTPHQGELKRLTSSSKPKDLLKYASEKGVTLLVKGEVDIITDGKLIKMNSSGHPRMAVGGTGDVLSGVCGALMAKGLTPFESARLAAYSLGKAGEICYEEIGSGFLPTDLALFLSKVLRRN